MNNKLIKSLVFVLLLNTIPAKSQSIVSYADSIRKAYKIPGLAFAVVSADNFLEVHSLGVRRVNTNFSVRPNDRFHLGSNTKAITSFLAALLVQQKQIKWETRFFELFPELQSKSLRVYDSITLQDLLTLRAKLPAYTYSSEKPTKKQINGDTVQQRYLLAKYFLSQKPMKAENGLTLSNAGYVLAGLMLEKASGKTYKELVTDFGDLLDVKFGFGYPNLTDTLQPYGHDVNLNIIPPVYNYKLDWLLSAGNINSNITDYATFIQLQLIGLKGESDLLSRATYSNLLFGRPPFSFGWSNTLDTTTQHHIAYNEGNAGAFTTQVQIIKEADRGYIIFTNSSTPETSAGITVLLEELKKRYGK